MATRFGGDLQRLLQIKFSYAIVVVGSILGTVPEAATAGTVLAGGGYQDVRVPGAISSLSPSILPYSNTQTAVLGGNSSKGTYAFSASQFDIQLIQTRSGALSSYGWGYGVTNFSVDANTTYSLSGFYNVLDTNDDPAEVYFNVYLRDFTTGIMLSQTINRSRVTANENFTLGTAGGDFSNTLTTPIGLTGNLVAGHQYVLAYDAWTEVVGTADSGGTATGRITLDIGDATAVPLPAASWAGLALFGLLGGKQSIRRWFGSRGPRLACLNWCQGR